MIERGQQENESRQDQMNQSYDSMSQQQGSPVSDNTSSQENGRGNGRSNRGFAAMDRERQKAIASEGGRAAHRQGVAHEWNAEEARQAGKKGGQIVSQNREHMSEIGRRGGQSSGSRRSQQRTGSENEGER
jgi:uncharacterized protein